MRRDASYIGANEVNQLVGKWATISGAVPWQTITGAVPWQTITGAVPWQTIAGADVSFPPWQQQPAPHHHHHHRRSWWQPQFGQQPQYGGGQYGGGQYGGGQYGQPQYDPYAVRDHRHAELEHRAYVMGDRGALALLGAEAAAAAAGPALPPAAVVPHPAMAAAMGPALPVTPAVVAPPAVATPEVPPEHPAHPNNVLPPNHPEHPNHPLHPHHRRFRATGWAPAVFQGPQPFWGPQPDAWPYIIPPRNLLVDRPGPTGADRVILPMSSGVNILPNTSAQITSRPQNYAFRPERCIISQADQWVINDIKVGNMSQFSQSGDVPGEMFGATTIDGFVKFTTCQTAMDFVIVTTFVGASESGAPFVCGVLGTAAVN